MRKLYWFVLIGVGALWLSVAAAQNNAAGDAGAANTKPKTEAADGGRKADEAKDERVVIENADSFVYNPDTKMYHMRGNVVFAREKMKLYCDEADYNEEADTAKARGHLRVVDPDSVITGDLIEADFGKELAVITGNVTIVTQKKGNKSGETPDMSLEKPKEGGGSGEGGNKPGDAAAGGDKPKDGKEPEHLEDYWKNKTTITCERVEYYYADDVKKMVATPRVKAVQEDKTVWADTAVFEDIARTITLTGNVVMNTEKGDEFKCSKALVWIDDDRIEAENAGGITLRKKKKEEPKPAGPTEKPAEQPAPVAPAAAPAKPEGSQ